MWVNFLSLLLFILFQIRLSVEKKDKLSKSHALFRLLLLFLYFTLVKNIHKNYTYLYYIRLQ